MDLTPGLLQRGQHGPRVKLLQSMLEALGHSPGAADGVFGARTLAAVKAFQKAHGLAPDGLVGRKTIAALNDATRDLDNEFTFTEDEVYPEPDDLAQRYAEWPPLSLGDAGEPVAELQQKLATVGYPVELTGDFDELTQTSVLDFQATYSIDPTGVADAQTLLALDHVIALQAAPAETLG